MQSMKAYVFGDEQVVRLMSTDVCRKEERKNWPGCFGPVMEDAELDFLQLLRGILEEYQSKLYFLKTLDYENFQACRCNESPVPITQFQQCCLVATSTRSHARLFCCRYHGLYHMSHKY